METIADRIKKVRETQGITQEEFGKRIGGVARNTITAYETGAREPSKQAIQLICTTYNVRREWLENGTGEMFYKDLFERLKETYSLTPMEMLIVKKFITADPKIRSALTNFVTDLVDVVVQEPEYMGDRTESEETLQDALRREIYEQEEAKEKRTGSDSIAG